MICAIKIQKSQAGKAKRAHTFALSFVIAVKWLPIGALKEKPLEGLELKVCPEEEGGGPRARH